MYQALYRKLRPQTFDDVIGQRHITETLRKQVISGRLSHAYIFIGTRGTGKTTCARILAKAVNCEHPVNGNPCCECESCRSITSGTAMDIVELDAASNNSVDNIRALREEAAFTPSSAKKRVYIIDEVHMLSISAFNALLKILEEPPEHLMFILATTELQKVPVTILSRCQRHSFKRIPADVLSDYIKKVAAGEKLNITAAAAELIAGMADGGVRDALSLLDQCSGFDSIDTDEVYSVTGLAGNRRICLLLENIISRDYAASIREFDTLWMDGKDPAVIFKELSGLLRDVLVAHSVKKGFESLVTGGYEPSSLRRFSQELTADEIVYMLDTIQNSMDSMRDRLNPKTTAEVCLISLCNNRLSDSAASMKARISRLEARLDELAVSGISCHAPDKSVWSREDLPEFTDREYEPSVSTDVVPASESYDYIHTDEDEPPFDMDDDDRFRDEPAEKKVPEKNIQPEALKVQVSADSSSPADIKQQGTITSDSSLWERVVAYLMPGFSFVLRNYLDDRSLVGGYLSGGAFKLLVKDSFMYDCFNRQDILAQFSEAVRTLEHMDNVNVTIEISDPAELTENQEKPQRDINELACFSEFKFSD